VDGYAVGNNQLTAFIRDWSGAEANHPNAFVPLKFELGEAFQFDWSEEGLVIGGIYYITLPPHDDRQCCEGDSSELKATFRFPRLHLT
jgi:hypothetical protein